jgi:hypothetical protein
MLQDPNADSRLSHLNADTDMSITAIHHTLGSSPTQASPGSHVHDGSDSYKINVADLEGTIPGALPAGGLADQVLTKIDGTDYNVEWSDATAITTTANLIKHYVKNDSGTTLAKGTVVYVSGANGTNILVKPALATSDATTATTIGFLEQTLASNAHGYVISEGLLTGLNTSAATAGDPMWLSGTTAGTVLYGLANEPHAPVHIVYLGTVTRANSSNGEIFIKVNNGWELQELHNVDALTPSNGDLLKYDSATSLWKNSAQSTLAIANTQVSGLGTASTKNIPATGNASATEVVYGTDTRLTNSRTPTAHASTHASAGSDPISIANTQVSGLGTASTKNIPATGNASVTEVVYGTDTRLTNSRTPTTHASTHASGGSDAITIAPAQVTGTAVITTDSRLSDARTPLSHTHGNISNTGTVTTSVTATNPVKVLITDTSNIVGTLTTTGASNTTFLRGDGTWSTPAGGGGSFTGGTLTSNLTLDDGTTTSAPLNFVSGVNLTTPVAGAVEYDGTVFYETPNATSGRALNPATYHYASTSNWIPDFSTSNTYQSLLGAATTGITVPAGTTFEYELKTTVRHQYITNSSISGNFSIIGTTVTGSPTVSTINYVDFGSNTTGFTTASAISAIRTTGTVSFSAAITTGSRYNVLYAKGIIRVTGTGTAKIYPAIAPNVASGDNIWTVSSGTTFKLTPIGNGTVTQVGTWA